MLWKPYSEQLLTSWWKISPFSYFFPSAIFDVVHIRCVRPLKKWVRLVPRPRLFSPYLVIERAVDWQWAAAAAELLRHGGGYSVTEDPRRSYVSFPSSLVGKARMKWYGRRENVFGESVLRGEAENELNCYTLVRWKHASLFSAVNSLGQQIWLLVPISTCYKAWSPVQANAVVALANFCKPRCAHFCNRSVLLIGRDLPSTGLVVWVSWESYGTTAERAMEPKHKELLDQCHQNLLESITDADRVIELLIVSGTLSQLDKFELEQNCSSSAEKVDHLLKMLTNKESDHFLDLCVALEKAYPDLYAALFSNNGGGPVDHSTGKTLKPFLNRLSNFRVHNWVMGSSRAVSTSWVVWCKRTCVYH